MSGVDGGPPCLEGSRLGRAEFAGSQVDGETLGQRHWRKRGLDGQGRRPGILVDQALRKAVVETVPVTVTGLLGLQRHCTQQRDQRERSRQGQLV